jgi:hypothetical protein
MGQGILIAAGMWIWMDVRKSFQTTTVCNYDHSSLMERDPNNKLVAWALLR